VGAPTTSDDTSAVWSGLTAGAYSVSVSDGVCSVDTEVDLAGFTVFDWTVNSFDYACESAPGAVSVLVSGGAEPLTIAGASSDGIITWAAADTVGLPAGDYTISVADAAGCTRDTALVIAALPALTLSASGTSISCHGAEDGAIEAMASGGSEPLTLGAEGPGGLLLEPFESLSAGTYIVGVVDARGCLADTTLTIAEPNPIVVVATATPESCEGSADGTALIDADGGTAPLTIQWEDGPQDSLWTSLAAGSFIWTVTDAQGCDTSGTVTVEPGGGLDVLVDVEVEACEGAGALASIHLSVTGNVDSATVLLGGLPADEVTSSGTSGVWTWTGLPSGVYGWTASLGPDCATSGLAEVDLPTPLSWTGLVDQPVCSGDSGVVVASSEGGALPVAWAWSGVSLAGDTLVGTGADSGALPAGQYDFVVTDSLGCSLLEPITIEAESNGLAVEVSITQPSCGGALVGEALVSPTGGLPPYDIIVEGAADSLSLPFLVPGTYPFTLTDSVGCAVGDTITIEPASDFELVADVDSASCANSEDGLILLETVNGVGEAEFTFVGPFGAVPTTDSIPDLMAGVYEITALDEAGCPAVLLVSVGAPPPIVVLLDSLDRPSCAGDLDGALSVTTEGGAGTGFDIQWTVDGLPAGQGPQLNGIGEGVYAVVVTDSAGCTGDIASIPLVAEGDVTLTVPADTALCAGLPLQLEAMAEGATELGWSLPGGETGVGLVAAVAELTEGEGQWIFTASRLGCVRTDSVTVTGWALPTPDAGPDQIVPEGGTTSIGGAGNPEWEHTWEPALDVVSPEAAATATEALFSATEFILTATTLEGCTASDTVLVDVLLELDIPSGFTPNADGINDAWNLGGLDQYPSAEITLFNRWGDVLLTYGSTDGSWDGTLNGIPVPVGTYYYHIRVNEPALQAEWTGPITLMR
ncbi:MAG: T9SS type B sorting domain-containing protein, partial [Flavobacteriales bacterium]